jgi:long-chain fatty acid transport protein
MPHPKRSASEKVQGPARIRPENLPPLTKVSILVRVFLSWLLLLAAGTPAMATNGMNMIGYNVRSSGMGGADVAIASDCSGSACNPATLGRYRENSMAFGISVLMPEVSNSYDVSPISVEGEGLVFPLPYLAYAQKLSPSSPWTLGFDLFAQGGVGVDVKNFPTSNGPGSYDSQVRYGRLTGAVNYRINDQLSLGLGAMIGYADMAFSLFPEYQGGFEVEDLSSPGYAGKVGAHYKFNEMVSFGAQYTSEADFDFDGGTLRANYGPAGSLTFDAEMEDFTWPQEAEFGIALQATHQLLLAADVKWIGWSSAIDLVKVRAKEGPAGVPPPASPGSDSILFNMNWDDQWVYAFGAEFAINQDHIVRLGYNYGKSPVPDGNLSPLFPAIVEHHITLGYGIILENWAVDIAYEHAFENTQTNNNQDSAVNPFGPGITVSQAQNTFHFAVTYFF